MSKTPTPGRTTGTRPAPAKTPDSAEAVDRFETARHRAAAKTADAILGRCLTFSEVVNGPEWSRFVDRIRREESTLCHPPEICSAREAERAIDEITAALPAKLHPAFGRLQDWIGHNGVCEAEAAYLIGLAIARVGGRP
jgi:hypothetical protein